MYQLGDVLSVQYTGYKHYGIYAGEGVVIHNSKLFKKVIEIPLSTFEDGKSVCVSNSIKAENPLVAIDRAKSYLNMPYGLFTENCEHFVRTACGLTKESTQVQNYLIYAFGAGVAIGSDNTALKFAGGAAALATALTPSEKSPVVPAAVAACLAAGLVLLAARS